jgi:hypothetical protein
MPFPFFRGKKLQKFGFRPIKIERGVSFSGYLMEVIKRQFVLNKGSEKYIFRYEPGQEGLLLDALVASANDTRTDFDWFDAAVVSFKLTQTLIHQADEILYKDLTDPMQNCRRDGE